MGLLQLARQTFHVTMSPQNPIAMYTLCFDYISLLESVSKVTVPIWLLVLIGTYI